MTRFQRRAMAIVIHAFNDDLGDRSKKVSINKRFVTVFSDSNKRLADYEVKSLSWNEVEIVDMYTKMKFYSESMGGVMRFRSEDEQYMTLEIHDVYTSLVRGKDGNGYRFEGRIEGYRKVRIKDDEAGKELTYLLSW
jgi:hypothetical protein